MAIYVIQRMKISASTMPPQASKKFDRQKCIFQYYIMGYLQVLLIMSKIVMKIG